jgi:glucosamine--fructose-6-phosphate aminotransferase (isomerizing)
MSSISTNGPSPLPGGGLRRSRIRRIFFVGQGTAGVAAQACADILKSYLADPAIQLRALKASELSGFEC